MAAGQLQPLLQQSLGNYRSLHALMEQLEEALRLDEPGLLLELHQQLQTMQQQAGATDAQIGPLLSTADVAAITPLLAERQALLQDLQGYNRLLSVKIHGILPVISAELAQLRTGRVAVSGYASGQQARGDLVRGAF